MATANFEDFYEVPNLNFDISKLKNDLDKILKLKKFNTPGVTHFGAIPLNQIPNDKSSIEGSNIRGKYWTIADETGKEVSRDVDIDESKYTKEYEKEFNKSPLVKHVILLKELNKNLADLDFRNDSPNIIIGFLASITSLVSSFLFSKISLIV